MGWLAGYDYRKPIPITGQAGAGVDYQVNLEVHPGAGADSDGVVYLNGHAIDFPEDVRFTDDDGVTPLDYWIEATEHFGHDGISQPFNFINHPSAIYYNGKTYIVWQARAGLDPYITYYDHSIKEWGPIVKVASSPQSADDHGAPAVAIDNNGYIHVFYGSHASAQKHAKSDGVEDISAFTVQADVVANATYPKPIVDGNDMYLFYRKTVSGTDMPECYKKSPDNGSSWGAENTIIEKPAANGRVYVGHIERTGSQIHMGWCYSDSGDTVRWDIYHAYLNTSDGKMYAIDGTDLGTTITEAEAIAECQVVDSLTDETNIPSLHLDGSGFPWMIYIKGTGGAYTFYHTRWNGSAWTAPSSIVATDNKWNYADFIINSVIDVEAYLTTAGVAGLGGNIDEWGWNGSAWGSVGTILSEAAANNPLNAPMIPVDFHSNLRLVFCQIHGAVYTDITLKLYAYSGSDFLPKLWGQKPFWVKVDDNLDANQNIYIYYGKSGDSSAADGDATFLFFDDFPGSSLDAAKWNNNVDGQDSLIIDDGLSIILSDVGGARSIPCLDSKNTHSHPIRVELRGLLDFLGPTGGGTSTCVRFTKCLHPTINTHWAVEAQCFWCAAAWRDASASDWNNWIGTENGNTWDEDPLDAVDVRESLIFKSGASKQYRDGVLEIADTNVTALTSSPYLGLHYYTNPVGAIGPQYINVNFVALRKHNDTEPVVGTAGGEEQNPDIVVPKAPAYGLDPMIF